jgi:hypothetical protein
MASILSGPSRGTRIEKREESAKPSTEYKLFSVTVAIIASVLNPNDFKGWSERHQCRVKKGKPKQDVGQS